MKDWSTIRFTGPDSAEWLQGQLTQDVMKRENAAFCWLEPSGRCLSFGWLQFNTDAIAVLVPQATVQAILKRVEDMVVMEDVLASLTDSSVLFTEPFNLTISDSSEPSDASENQQETVLLERGFPIWGVDITERSIPFDLGSAFATATISPNKGCYIGQEIIARMRSHDQKPRDWIGLLVEQEVHPNDAVGSFGAITRYVFSPTLGHIASASISKQNLQDGQIVEVSTENGKVKAEVRHMPLLRG